MTNLNENLQIPEPYLSFLQAVESVPAVWASHPLEDLEDAPQFDRQLVVTGFNAPRNAQGSEDRIYITVEQIWTLKSTGKVFVKKDAPMWETTADTWSYLRDFSDPSKLVEVDKIEPAPAPDPIYDPETGEEIPQQAGEPIRSKSFIRIPTTKYLRFLMLNRNAHLVDLFGQYLRDFAAAKQTDLDKL